MKDVVARTCREESCDRPVLARGLCNTHYSRWRNASIRAGAWEYRLPFVPQAPRPIVPTDHCGSGTRWGCGRRVVADVHILVKGRSPLCSGDDGHVLFHAACSPAVVDPDAVRRWRGSYTGRREATA